MDPITRSSAAQDIEAAAVKHVDEDAAGRRDIEAGARPTRSRRPRQLKRPTTKKTTVGTPSTNSNKNTRQSTKSPTAGISSSPPPTNFHTNNNNTKATTKRKKSSGIRLHVLLFRAVVFIALFHYGLLVLLYHGFLNVDDPKDILQMAQDFVPLEFNGTTIQKKQNKGQNAPAKPWKVLWAIESKNTDQDKLQRQAVRDTYLKYSTMEPLIPQDDDDDTNKNVADNHSSIFCSLREIQANKVNNTESCVFYYVFIIRDNHVSTVAFSASEPDVEVWNDQNQGAVNAHKVFNYTLELQQSYGLDSLAWVQSDVVVFPTEILDKATPLTTGNYAIKTPNAPMPQKCSGCQWDKEVQLRTGNLVIVSNGLMQDVEQAKDLPSCVGGGGGGGGGPSVEDTLWNCVQEAMQQKKVTGESHRIGHQYRGSGPQRFQGIWTVHTQALENLQGFARKTKVHHIVANFDRDYTKYDQPIADFETALMIYGFLPEQIHTYGGAFPDFITNDYRWEEHTEFMNDNTLEQTDAGFGFWRAALVEHHWNMIEDGDFIVYSDTDIWNHLPFVMELLEQMLAQHANLAINAVHFPENQWTKRDMYETMCSVEQGRFMPQDRSLQYSGQFLVLRKSPGADDFLKRYLKILQNFRYLSNQPSLLPNYPEFREHRWAQSALSLLLKCKYMETGKQLFPHPQLKNLGWFDLFTFQVAPLGA